MKDLQEKINEGSKVILIMYRLIKDQFECCRGNFNVAYYKPFSNKYIKTA